MASLSASPCSKSLQILQGLPVSCGLLEGEVLLLYNLLASDFGKPSQVKIPLRSNILLEICATLTRVHDFLKLEEICSERETSVEEKLVKLFKPCLLAAVEHALYPSLCLLAVGISAHFIQNKKTDPAKRLLQFLQKLFNRKTNYEGVDCDIKVRLSGSQKMWSIFLGSQTEAQSSHSRTLVLREVVCYLLADIALQHRDYSSCAVCLDNIGDGSLQNVQSDILYTKALAYYQQKDYGQVRQLMRKYQEELSLGAGTHSNNLREKMCNLCGCILATGHKSHSALQMYKEAVCLNPQSLVSVYNIALEYRRLGRSDAELETLALLTAAVEDTSCNQKFDIKIEEVIYTLCRRCVELGRYQEAGEYYLKLLERIRSEVSHVSIPQYHLVRLPSVTQLYLEAVYCLLVASRLPDCVRLCDRILNKCPVNPSKSQSQDQLNSSRSQSQIASNSSWKQSQTCHESSCGKRDVDQKKRLHSEEVVSVAESQDSDPDTAEETNPTVVALLWKADALMLMEQPLQALECLDRLLELEVFQVDEMETSDVWLHLKDPASKPPYKKLKLDSGEAVPVQGEPPSQQRSLLADVYNKRSVVLVGLGRATEALQHSRWAYQLLPDDISVLYNHCVILHQLARGREAAAVWLTHRGPQLPIDPFQLQTLLKKKRSQLGSLEESDQSTEGTLFLENLKEKDLLNMDIVSLTLINKLKSY